MNIHGTVRRPNRDLTLQQMAELANARGSGAFTEAEIAEANRRHDRHYGWTIEWAGIYTNAARFPETVIGPLDWDPISHRPL